MRTISLGGGSYRREVKWGTAGAYHGQWAVVTYKQKAPWELHMEFNCRIRQPLTQGAVQASVTEEGWPLYRTSLQRMRSKLPDGQERFWWKGTDEKGRAITLGFCEAYAWFQLGKTCWSVSCPDIRDMIGAEGVEGQVGIHV